MKSTTHSEARIRLADLKIEEAGFLRVAAEIEKSLTVIEAEAAKVRRQIELLTQQIGARVGPEKTAIGRAKREDIQNLGRETAETPLPTVIEKLIGESMDGLSLADLIQKLAEKRCFRSSTRRSMVDQAIGRLKKKGAIIRNPENMRYFLNKPVD